MASTKQTNQARAHHLKWAKNHRTNAKKTGFDSTRAMWIDCLKNDQRWMVVLRQVRIGKALNEAMIIAGLGERQYA